MSRYVGNSVLFSTGHADYIQSFGFISIRHLKFPNLSKAFFARFLVLPYLEGRVGGVCVYVCKLHPERINLKPDIYLDV